MRKLLQNTLALLIILLVSQSRIRAQMMIKKIDAIYVSKEDGRIIPNDEFQSYKGVYTFHKLIKGTGGKDTILITPPDEAYKRAAAKRKEDFKAQVGKPLQTFNTIDLFGSRISSDELKGKVLVLNFWFIACAPCVAEMPLLNDLVQQYKDRDDIVFLGFANDTKESLGKFLGHTAFDYEIIPKSRDIAKDFLVAAYPTNFVVGKDGKVLYAHTGLGKNTVNDIATHIKKALN